MYRSKPCYPNIKPKKFKWLIKQVLQRKTDTMTNFRISYNFNPIRKAWECLFQYEDEIIKLPDYRTNKFDIAEKKTRIRLTAAT